MAFLNTVFPEKISYGSAGGPLKNSRVATAASGFSQRAQYWDESLHQYDISYGIRNDEDLYEVLKLFEVANGKQDFFLFKDNSDFKSVDVDQTISNLDVQIGVGDDAETNFQLIKEYTLAATTRTRTIRRPNVSTVVVAIDGIDQPSGWTVSATTGIVNFSSPPAAAEVITAGYEFYVPVRFDTDDLSWVLTHFRHGAIDSIILVEVKE